MTDGWIEWQGTSDPATVPCLPQDTYVEVRRKNGNIDSGMDCDFCWDDVGQASDIIAYRIMPAATEH